MSDKMISWNKEMVKRLRKAYDTAVKDQKTEFIFDENQYLTTFAKYLLEYLEPKFGIARLTNPN